ERRSEIVSFISKELEIRLGYRFTFSLSLADFGQQFNYPGTYGRRKTNSRYVSRAWCAARRPFCAFERPPQPRVSAVRKGARISGGCECPRTRDRGAFRRSRYRDGRIARDRRPRDRLCGRVRDERAVPLDRKAERRNDAPTRVRAKAKLT